MKSTPAGWQIIDEDAGVLAYFYAFTPGSQSTTFAARMANGEMLVVSPCTQLTDAIADDLLAYGPVGAVVANNGFHHLGQGEWHERFPNARRFAPTEAMTRIRKKGKVLFEFEPLDALSEIAGPDLSVREVPNTKMGEMWCSAKVAGGSAWFLSDVLANMPELPKSLPIRLLFKWTRSAPGFKVFRLGLKFIVKDPKATLRLLLDDMEANEPTVIVPGHGGLLSQPGLFAETKTVIEAEL